MTRSSKAFLFPGQGSQYVGMGKDFYETFSVAKDTFQEADEILGTALSRTIFSGPDEALTETSNSQVAIFTVSVALLRVLQDQLPGWVAGFFAGHSLGEYTALMASGRLSFADTLRLVNLRARYMGEAAKKCRGTMAVVLGLDGPSVLAKVQEMHLPQDLWVANFNCPGQVVISGTEKGIEQGSQAMLAIGARRAMPLKVSGAFHSGLMKEAEERLQKDIQDAPIQVAPTGLVMNVTGGLCDEVAQIKRNLAAQVTGSVQWESCIKTLESQGVQTYLEIGPGKTLAGLNKRIGTVGPTYNLEKVADLENLAKEARS